MEREEIDFEVIKENWNLYKLADGTTLKTKLIVIRVIREDIDDIGTPIYGAATTNVLGIIPAKDLRSTPSSKRYSPQEIISSKMEDIKFETLQEDWNEYRLKGDNVVLGVKQVVTQVSRTDKFDEKGDPIYHVQLSPIMKGDIPQETREKLLKIKLGKRSN